MDLITQFGLIETDITNGEYGKALTDAAPILTAIGGFVTGLGFAVGPMTAEQHAAGQTALEACIAACDTAAKKVKGTPAEVGKIGDGTILAALSKLLALALQFWPLIAPFLKP